MFKYHVSFVLTTLMLASTGFCESVISGDSPLLPRIPAKIIYVADYLAKGGDPQDKAKAIQSAIDAAESAGGGVVELPSGNLLSGPLRLASKIDLRVPVGTTLTMLPLDRYPGGTKTPPTFIEADHLHDVSISGGGTIEG